MSVKLENADSKIEADLADIIDDAIENGSIKNHSDSADQQKQARSNLFQDPLYIKSSREVLDEALKKGLDVLQQSNGDVIVSGMMPFYVSYTWNPERKMLMRKQVTKRTKKSKLGQKITKTSSDRNKKDSQ